MPYCQTFAGRMKLLCRIPTGLERPPRVPWQQSGVAPARFGDLFSGAFLRRDLLTGFAFLGLADEEGEGLREESRAG